jgi:hypothetical protein
MTYYIGRNLDSYNKREERYFYGLKRDDETGFVSIDKVNLDKSLDTLNVVNLDRLTGNHEIFQNLQEGVDFFEGRGVDHELQYDGLNYEQYKWSADDLYYYIDSEGQLSVRINQPYSYPEGVTTILLPSQILLGNPIDLGLVFSSNPLENQNIVDLGFVNDLELTQLAIDLGSIT